VRLPFVAKAQQKLAWEQASTGVNWWHEYFTSANPNASTSVGSYTAASGDAPRNG